MLRGRCSSCQAPISLLYPLVELATAALWFAAFSWPDVSVFTALRLAVFGTVMLGVATTDARAYVIPDQFTVFAYLFLLATAVAAALRGDASLFAGPWDAFVGAFVGAGVIAITGWLGEVALKREAMGFGDATLMAVIGAALGPERALLNVFIAAAIGSVAFLVVIAPYGWLRARRESREFEMPLVPFGVFLAPAAVGSLLWGYQLIDAYFQILPQG